MKHIGIKCGKCGDEVYSWARHHFVHCSCGAVFADGGFDYGRFGYDPGTPSSTCSTTVRCEYCDAALTGSAYDKWCCQDCAEQEITEQAEGE